MVLKGYTQNYTHSSIKTVIAERWWWEIIGENFYIFKEGFSWYFCWILNEKIIITNSETHKKIYLTLIYHHTAFIYTVNLKHMRTQTYSCKYTNLKENLLSHREAITCDFSEIFLATGLFIVNHWMFMAI